MQATAPGERHARPPDKMTSRSKLPARPCSLPRRRRALLVGAILGTAVIGSALSGCAASAPPAVALKPLDHRRALGLIERAIRTNGEQPVVGRTVKLRDGTPLQESFAIAASPYGVVYVTEEQATRLAGALPARNPDNEKLTLHPSENAITLVLYQDTYRYDTGEAHTVTAVTAENQLQKDVTDFIHHVVKQRKR